MQTLEVCVVMGLQLHFIKRILKLLGGLAFIYFLKLNANEKAMNSAPVTDEIIK